MSKSKRSRFFREALPNWDFTPLGTGVFASESQFSLSLIVPKQYDTTSTNGSYDATSGLIIRWLSRLLVIGAKPFGKIIPNIFLGFVAELSLATLFAYGFAIEHGDLFD